MPFCRSCGKEIPVEASFCPSCGAAATPVYSASPPAPNEFDRITKDSRVQEHWFRRVIAYIIDWIIVSIAAAILGLIAVGLLVGLSAFTATNFFFPFGGIGFGILGISALLFLLYFTVMEGTYQRTVGKSFLGLRVSTVDGGPIDMGQAFIRNISKIYWLLLLLDLIGGFFLNVRPGQRYLDKVANTIVVSAH
ncbi:MAG: RDD family protein [Rhabdochlamydiaceae bacterium]